VFYDESAAYDKMELIYRLYHKLLFPFHKMKELEGASKQEYRGF
jgi:hypothetical protein